MIDRPDDAEAIYQHSGDVFDIIVYPDRVTIRRKAGIGPNWCALCGRPLEQPPTGHRRTYCSDRCRNRACRRKKRNGEVSKDGINQDEFVTLVYQEEITIPTIDIQCLSGDSAPPTLTIWTGLTTNQDFYIGTAEELDALYEAFNVAAKRFAASMEEQSHATRNTQHETQQGGQPQ
jgi:hypothetical protein